MGPFDQHRQSQYVPQYVEFPVEALMKATQAKQADYDYGIQGYNKIKTMLEQYNLNPGDEYLRGEINEAIEKDFGEIINSGRFQDAVYLVPEVARKRVVANRDLLDALQTSQNIEEARKIRTQLGSSGIDFTPIPEGGWQTTKVIDPVTGEKKTQVYHYDIEQRKDHEAIATELMANIKPEVIQSKFKPESNGFYETSTISTDYTEKKLNSFAKNTVDVFKNKDPQFLKEYAHNLGLNVAHKSGAEAEKMLVEYFDEQGMNGQLAVDEVVAKHIADSNRDRIVKGRQLESRRSAKSFGSEKDTLPATNAYPGNTELVRKFNNMNDAEIKIRELEEEGNIAEAGIMKRWIESTYANAIKQMPPQMQELMRDMPQIKDLDVSDPILTKSLLKFESALFPITRGKVMDMTLASDSPNKVDEYLSTLIEGMGDVVSDIVMGPVDRITRIMQPGYVSAENLAKKTTRKSNKNENLYDRVEDLITTDNLNAWAKVFRSNADYTDEDTKQIKEYYRKKAEWYENGGEMALDQFNELLKNGESVTDQIQNFDDETKNVAIEKSIQRTTAEDWNIISEGKKKNINFNDLKFTGWAEGSNESLPYIEVKDDKDNKIVIIPKKDNQNSMGVMGKIINQLGGTKNPKALELYNNFLFGDQEIPKSQTFNLPGNIQMEQKAIGTYDDLRIQWDIKDENGQSRNFLRFDYYNALPTDEKMKFITAWGIEDGIIQPGNEQKGLNQLNEDQEMRQKLLMQPMEAALQLEAAQIVGTYANYLKAQ